MFTVEATFQAPLVQPRPICGLHSRSSTWAFKIEHVIVNQLIFGAHSTNYNHIYVLIFSKKI